MIDRGNWKAVKEYLTYRREVDQLSAGSVKMEETLARHLLEWAQNRPFEKAPSIRPTLPDYLRGGRRDGKARPLSPAYVEKVIGAGRRFLHWLSVHRAGYRGITQSWLDTLKPYKTDAAPVEHEAVTLEEVRAMASAPVVTMAEKRIRAAAVFWFLSAIRIGAFLSLPLAAVNIDARTLKQWPSLGVKTKFKKHATTFLLNIPDLLDVVREWDSTVRAALPAGGYWFAPLLPDMGEIDSAPTNGKTRHVGARNDLRDWLARVGLPYHSPHKFRHGHAVYALKQAQDVGDLKAVSQNLMHSNLSITDGVYGILSKDDVEQRIAGLGGGKQSEGAIRLLEQMLAELKGKS